jgi:hypothetical protein
MGSLRIAFGVFMSGDIREARRLLAEEAVVRNAELAAIEWHPCPERTCQPADPMSGVLERTCSDRTVIAANAPAV